MNVKRFTARTSRDALTLVRQAFGDDAVVLSTKPCPEGVEVLAMAPESVQQIERFSAASIRCCKVAAAARSRLDCACTAGADVAASRAMAKTASAGSGRTGISKGHLAWGTAG